MQGTFTIPSGVIVRHAQGLDCPKCSSPVYRVPRRVLDMLLGTFQPVRRYHCRSMVCGWEGNLRALPGGSARQHHRDPYTPGHGRLGSSLTGAFAQQATDGAVPPSLASR